MFELRIKGEKEIVSVIWLMEICAYSQFNINPNVIRS